MKKLLKAAKWTAIFIVLIIVSLAVIIASRQNLTYDAPYPDIKASKDSAVIARGRHLVISSAHCIDCHHRGDDADSFLRLGLDVPLSGGGRFDLPVGTIYSKNITPDMETGIGKFTDGEIARALYYGVHPDGTVVYDFMPFHNMSKEDMTAVISYLRSQKPIHYKVPENHLNMIGYAVKAFMVKPVGPKGPIVYMVQQDTTAEYGGYLVNNVANCSGCHTQRSLAGEFTGAYLAGGNPMETPGKPTLTPPNLTPDPSSRIYGWTKETFINRMHMGKLIAHSHMPWNCYKNMTDDELTAIFAYLQTVKPQHTAE